MRTLAIHAPWQRGWASSGWLGDALLVVASGDGVSLVDVERIAAPSIALADAPIVARLADVSATARRGDELIAADRAHVLRRYRGTARLDAFTLPAELRGTDDAPVTRLAWSPSGRFVLVHTRHAHLFELDGWRLVRTIPLVAPTFGHAGFTTLPSGEDVLFIAAPSYMGLQMIDCASGETMHAYEPGSGFDFCHTNFELSRDGARLHAFGCTWAAPCSARIYDARPWTAGAAPAPGFPLPTIFERAEGEIHGAGDAWPIPAAPDPGGTVPCFTTVDLSLVPALGSEDDLDWRADASDDDRALSDELSAAAATHRRAIVIRRVDPIDARVRRWTVHPYAGTREAQVIVRGGDLIAVASDRVRRIGADGIEEDLGPAPPRPDGASGTALLRGDLLVDVVRPPTSR